jgi:hypothetical protein
MNEFKREERYVVFKLSKLHSDEFVRSKQLKHLDSAYLSDARVDCVVVEADWPEYELVWNMLEARITGSPFADHTKCHEIGRVQAEQMDTLKAECDSLKAELSKALTFIESVRSVPSSYFQDRLAEFRAQQST